MWAGKKPFEARLCLLVKDKKEEKNKRTEMDCDCKYKLKAYVSSITKQDFILLSRKKILYMMISGKNS